MDPIKLTIDNVEIEAMPGDTILQAARRNGMGDRIPTLCEEPGLPHQTSCFVCVVEMEGMTNKLPPACSTPVAPGMKIFTNTDKVRASRKTALELLLSNHPADCVGPCVRACPAHVDVQKYVAQVRAGKYEEAVRTIRANNPFVAVCGRVCVRKCEDECRRDMYEDPVGINMIKRYLGDWEKENPVEDTAGVDTGKKVAVIGGGPAGLTAAYYLRLQGHGVDVFESQNVLGGMLRFGIPDYRLPDEILDYEINHILDLGVNVEYGKTLGKEITLEGLQQDYDAVFLSMGAWKSMPGRIPGEDAPTVLSGIKFLYDAKIGQAPDLKGKKVAVVGGGNTAIDAARTAVRLDAEQVQILYRRTRKEMPAHEEEIVGAEDESVELNILAAPINIAVNDKGVTEVTCQKMELGEPDASGRRRPVAIEGSEHIVEVDYLIMAIGQRVDLAGVEGDKAPEINKWGSLEADLETGATNVPNTFGAGDNVTGPKVVIDAIGSAHLAANAIDEYLSTGQVSKLEYRFDAVRENFGEVVPEHMQDVAEIQRHKQPEVEGDVRKANFDEVEGTLPLDQVLEETERCLRCGCNAQEACTLRNLADEYGAQFPFDGEANYSKPDRSNSRISLERNKCILCGRCIRICSDVVGVNALGFVDRGFDTMLMPTMGRPLSESPCISCGNCAESCPTGAMTFLDPWDMCDPTEEGSTICALCGNGCELDVADTPYGFSFRSAHSEEGVLQPLCALGRFGNRKLIGSERLTKPMIRKNGELVEATFEEAIAAAVEGIQKTGNTIISAGPSLTVEEGYAVKTLADAFGAKAQSFTDALLGANGFISTATFEDLESASQILWIGDHGVKNNPVLTYRLRRALRNGAKLTSITTGKSAISKLADNAILGEITQDAVKSVAGELTDFVAVMDELEACLVLSALDGIEGCKVLFNRTTANANGLRLAGINTEVGFENIYSNAKSAWLFGEDVVGLGVSNGDNPEFLVASDLFETETTKAADVVLPMSSYMETGGSFVKADGTLCSTDAVLPAKVEVSTLDMLTKALQSIESDFDASGIAAALGLDGMTVYQPASNKLEGCVPTCNGDCPVTTAAQVAIQSLKQEGLIK